MSCNLEVDVNGRESFFVHEKVIASFSGRFRKLFQRSTSETRGLKVILHEFPGGEVGFELILRFCYNGGRIGITPCNVVLLHSAANFMEMNDLIKKTEMFLECGHYWTWFELIHCLKLFQELAHFEGSLSMLQKFLVIFVASLLSPQISSPSSLESSNNIQSSGEISTSSSRDSSSLPSIWFRELDFLSIGLFEKVAKTMISRKIDDTTICSFVDHYQRMKFRSLSPSGKRRITKIVINLYCSLDGRFISFRSLCNMLHVSLTLKITKSSMKRLECLIGSRLDEAALDDLLVVSPSKQRYAYDVDLVLRLLKIFLDETRNQLSRRCLKKVACLMDSYIAEVAPDPRLKPSKFRSLVFALPDFARDSHDRIYEAMDMYFLGHTYLCEEEKRKICYALNEDKLSSGSLMHLARNPMFPVEDRATLYLGTGDEWGGMELQKVKKFSKERKIKAANVKKFDVKCSNGGRSLPILCS